MKICVVNNLYKPYNRGGAEQVISNFVSQLKKNHNTFLISTKPFWKKEESDENVYYLHSFYYCLSKFPKIFRLFWHFYNIVDIFTAFKVYFILKREKPDLVLTHNLEGLTYLLPSVIKILKIKHIHTLHDIQLLHPSGLIYHGNEGIINSVWAKTYQAITRFLFSSVKIIISPSEWLLQEYQNKKFFNNTKNTIILNPLTEISKNYQRRSDDVFRFLFIGQIEDHKGIFLLINAFKKLDDAKTELIIIGPGSKLKIIKKDFDEYQNIKILGKKDHQEAMKYLFKVDCLVVPSLCYENSPTVIYEAFLSSVSVIASDIGGNLELINNYGGFLFKADDDNDLTQKMKLVIKNPQKGDKEKFINDTRIGLYIDKLLKL